MQRQIVVIAHDLRSTHNVGSLIRTCEGLGINHIYLTGYTPYPLLRSDETRLPHIALKLGNQIHKTALGAENMIPWTHESDITACLSMLRRDHYNIVALEQFRDSVPLHIYKAPDHVALLLGREVEGIQPELLNLCDTTLEIPMFGHKESYNVVQAAAMALYQLRFG